MLVMLAPLYSEKPSRSSWGVGGGVFWCLNSTLLAVTMTLGTDPVIKKLLIAVQLSCRLLTEGYKRNHVFIKCPITTWSSLWTIWRKILNCSVLFWGKKKTKWLLFLHQVRHVWSLCDTKCPHFNFYTLEMFFQMITRVLNFCPKIG